MTDSSTETQSKKADSLCASAFSVVKYFENIESEKELQNGC